MKKILSTSLILASLTFVSGTVFAALDWSCTADKPAVGAVPPGHWVWNNPSKIVAQNKVLALCNPGSVPSSCTIACMPPAPPVFTCTTMNGRWHATAPDELTAMKQAKGACLSANDVHCAVPANNCYQH